MQSSIMAMTCRRFANLMVHTSPLDQAGTGDAGGMNIYPCESAQKMAVIGVQIRLQVNWVE
jgi:D-inositol-3-phosphate glycosyltransferase